MIIYARSNPRTYFCYWCGRLHPKFKSWAHPPLHGIPAVPDLKGKHEIEMSFGVSLSLADAHVALYTHLYNSSNEHQMPVAHLYRETTTRSGSQGKLMQCTRSARILQHNYLTIQQSCKVIGSDRDTLMKRYAAHQARRICVHHTLCTRSHPSWAEQLGISKSAPATGVSSSVKRAGSCAWCITDFACTVQWLNEKRS